MHLSKKIQNWLDQADIHAILPTYELVFFTKFYNNWFKIVDCFLMLYFWASAVFLDQSLLSILHTFAKSWLEHRTMVRYPGTLS